MLTDHPDPVSINGRATRMPMADVPTPPANEAYERFFGSRLLLLFGGGFLDQTVLDDVSAGVEWGGRFRDEPYARALRTFSAQDRTVPGTEESRRRTAAWLRRAHRDVKGIHNGVRFSALQPEAWNWILMSALRVFVEAYPVLTGDQFRTDTEVDDFYRYALAKFRYLELPSERNRLPRTWPEFEERYEEIMSRRAQWTISLEREAGRLVNPPNPFRLLPTAVWRRVSAPLARVGLTASFGILHPTVRELSPVVWTASNDEDFARLARILPVIYRLTPPRIGSTPLAYHTWRTRQLTAKMERAQLSDFRPRDEAAARRSAGCPI